MRREKRGFYKKAVSPLIATVLLISFAVALGSVVLNWGRNLDISDASDACAEAELKLQSLANADICYSKEGNQGFLKFSVENKGTKPIEGLGVWIVGQKGTKLSEYNEFVIPPGGTLDVPETSVEYHFETYGEIKQVQLIPSVRSEDSIEICPSNSIKTESVAQC